MEYTVIGDVVNETFRIQDLTRDKANSILIGESTYNQVKSAIRTRSCGLKKLDTSLVNIYEVVGEEQMDVSITDTQLQAMEEDYSKIH